MTFTKLSGTVPRITIKIILDISVFLTAFILCYVIRFPLKFFVENLEPVLFFIPLVIVLRLGSFALFKVYASMWRYSGVHDLLQIIKATTLSTVLIVSSLAVIGHTTLPRSIIATDWLLVIFLSGGLRLTIRKIYSLDLSTIRQRSSFSRVLIFGAGRAGELLLRNIENTREVQVNVIGFLDDDPNKQGKYIHNKQVMGDRAMIAELVSKFNINEIYFSVPSLPGVEIRQLLNIIGDQISDKVVIKTMPGLSDLVSERITWKELRKIEIKDLLRREPVKLDFEPVKELIRSKTVLVVGGGGSIGLELCRQIASFDPGRLLILDNSEFNLYSAETAINNQYPDLKLVPLIVDATSEVQVRRVLKEYKPTLLFHAAAYKHVPLMEINPWSAVNNNLKTTLTLSRLAVEYMVERFILISTDKAVQPTSVMGVTKRICEIIARTYHNESKTQFMVVRFGNVLGSSGSVIPKFKQQIDDGGPLTVTHPEISRYFMLTSEAVELVLQAGAVGDSGNIYVLDMGEPIRIVDLAKYMIELSGLKENQDVGIVFTGLRPGEKLRESLYFQGEESATRVPGLLVLKPKVNHEKSILKKIEKLLNNLYDFDYHLLITELKNFVPEYHPDPNSNGHSIDELCINSRTNQRKPTLKITEDAITEVQS